MSAIDEVDAFLTKRFPHSYAASEIVMHTGLPTSSVRKALSTLRDRGVVERSLDIGLNGKILYLWSGMEVRNERS